MGHKSDMRRWARRLAMLVAAGGGMALLSGCSGQGARFGLLAAASDRAKYMGHLWVGAWIASLLIGGLVWGLIFYSIYRFRRRPGNEVPRQTKYNLPMELLYTLVPIFIIVVLFFFTVKAQDAVLANDHHAQHTVDVVAQKWSWTFNYMEAGNDKVGTVVHEVGTLEKIPELYLVVNQSVQFNLKSADVIHSFWVPAFYFKMDVIPGHPNSFELTPTVLGTYQGKCAELCGTYHSSMIFVVHVVTEQEYYQQLDKLKADGQVGEITPPAAATYLPSSGTSEGP